MLRLRLDPPRSAGACRRRGNPRDPFMLAEARASSTDDGVLGGNPRKPMRQGKFPGSVKWSWAVLEAGLPAGGGIAYNALLRLASRSAWELGRGARDRKRSHRNDA